MQGVCNMTAGRPPKPYEVKQAQAKGDGRTPSGELVRQTMPLDARMARKELIPPIPKGTKFNAPARKLWNELWTAAWWLHDEDIHLVIPICKNADRIHQLEREIPNSCHQCRDRGVQCSGYIIHGGGYMGKGDIENPLLPSILKMERAMVSDLGNIGIGPTGRNKLGILEIKRASGLADLQNKAAKGFNQDSDK
jgi:hypothetical protein